VLGGLETFYFVRAELKTARELAEQYLSLAQSRQDPGALAIAHILLGRNYYEIGESASALTHEEQGLALYNPHVSSSMDLRLAGLQYAAFALWYLGYPDQALKRGQEALTLAQESFRPFGLTYALQNVALLSQYRREEQKAQEYAETVITLCTEQGFPQFLAYATCVRGWALAVQGQGKEGIAQMRQGLAAFRATGAENGRPYYLCHLAEAYGKVGQTEEGLNLVVEALAQVHKMGAHYTEAELYRLKGELTLQQFQVSGSKFQVANPQSLTPNP
jgi:predicted ATPase